MNKEKTKIIGLEKITDEDGRVHYLMNVYVKDIGKHVEIKSWFDDGVKLLGRLNELMEKFDIENLDFLDSVLSLLRDNVCITEYAEKTRHHMLKYFNKDFAFRLSVGADGSTKEISSTDFERLKMFLPKENVFYSD